jgi:hypothetical protein
VSHYSRLSVAVVDVPDADHDKELTFWQAASGETLTRLENEPAYHGGWLRGQQFALLVQRLGDGAARVHLDIRTDDLEAEVTRLEGLGARRERREKFWWVMRDPAGLPFCVVEEPTGRLTDANAHRWD